MKKFIKDIFLKSLKLNLINILIIILSAYLSSLSRHKYFLLYLILLRVIGVSMDYSLEHYNKQKEI